MDEPTIRQATLADKEAVLSIHYHVYDGRDYLPVCYDEIVSSPNVTAFVMIHGDSAVSYYNNSYFLASCGFRSQLITFANSLDPDQDRQNVGPDPYPKRLTR